MLPRPTFSIFFFFNAPAPTEIYTLSLHDALPICGDFDNFKAGYKKELNGRGWSSNIQFGERSEEHTSELQSHVNLVCRLLLEKKKKKKKKRKKKKKKKKKKK